MPKAKLKKTSRVKTVKSNTTKAPKRTKKAKPSESQQLAKIIVNACEDGKALDITALNVEGLAAFTNCIVICSATSTRQAHALYRRIDKDTFAKTKTHPIGVEGLDAEQWILMDYGDVVCHIFLESVRDFYRLEDIWFDAPPL